MSSQEGFPDGQCVQDKNTKQKYKVISKEMQPERGEYYSRQYFETNNGKYPPPPEYEYTLENAKTGQILKDKKPHSDLKSCYYIDKKIEKGDCVKNSMLGPGYIVKSISPNFKLTLKDKKTEEELTEPVPIEDYYHCSRNSKSNNQDTNTEEEEQQVGGHPQSVLRSINAYARGSRYKQRAIEVGDCVKTSINGDGYCVIAMTDGWDGPITLTLKNKSTGAILEGEDMHDYMLCKMQSCKSSVAGGKRRTRKGKKAKKRGTKKAKKTAKRKSKKSRR